MSDNFGRMDDLSKLSPDELRNVLDFDQNAQEAESALNHMQSMAAIACAIHPPKEAFPLAVCRHCKQQDEIKPDGIVYCPNNLILCFTCLRLWRAKRINIGKDIVVSCGSCVLAEVDRIRKLNSNLVVDLRNQDWTGKR